LNPDRDNPLRVDCYVDADFAGLFGFKQPHDPASVKSRTRFIICAANCPVIWTSRLQHLIATSTTEAEHNALSESMRDVLPLQEIIKVITTTISYESELDTTFQTIIHEDNSACMKLANLLPRQFTPRTKHYSIKVHWFRSHLLDSGKVIKIDTKFQCADILTKALSTAIFEDIRMQLCGW
jgi:hypothetical protein